MNLISMFQRILDELYRVGDFYFLNRGDKIYTLNAHEVVGFNSIELLELGAEV